MVEVVGWGMRFLVVLGLAVGLMAGDISGKWDAKVDTSAGSGNPTFVFKQEGETLTGSYSGQLGESKVTGTVKGDVVEFQFEIAPQGEKIVVYYKGKVEGPAKMSGTLEIPGLADGKWTAEKLK